MQRGRSLFWSSLARRWPTVLTFQRNDSSVRESVYFGRQIKSSRTLAAVFPISVRSMNKFRRFHCKKLFLESSLQHSRRLFECKKKIEILLPNCKLKKKTSPEFRSAFTTAAASIKAECAVYEPVQSFTNTNSVTTRRCRLKTWTSS